MWVDRMQARSMSAVERVNADSARVLDALNAAFQQLMLGARAKHAELDKQLQDAAFTFDVNASQLRALARAASVNASNISGLTRDFCIDTCVLYSGYLPDIAFATIYSSGIDAVVSSSSSFFEKYIVTSGEFQTLVRLVCKDASGRTAEWVTAEDVTVTFWNIHNATAVRVTGDAGVFEIECASKETYVPYFDCTVCVNGHTVCEWKVEFGSGMTEELREVPYITFFRFRRRDFNTLMPFVVNHENREVADFLEAGTKTPKLKKAPKQSKFERKYSMRNVPKYCKR